jgi:valyl-tRNA synthetase
MIIAGYEYRGREPFKNVYLTGIVRDKLGRKMSKSLGNSPDPLDLIAKYGADSVRLGMLFTSPAGNDLPYDDSLCEQGRNFCNKIWNAWRLVEGWKEDASLAQPESASLAVLWMRRVLARDITAMEEAMAQYRISDALMILYKLFWDEFSGWYLEMVKPGYQQPIDPVTLGATKAFFDILLRLLHPFTPFITEELWQGLAPRSEGTSIMMAPVPMAGTLDEALLSRFAQAQEVVTAVRNIRKQNNIPSREALELKVIADENYPAEFAPVIVKMAGLSAITPVTDKDPAAAAFIVKTTQYFVPLAEKVDTEAELEKMRAELVYLEGFLHSVMGKLSNERFVAGAPAKVVETERAKQTDAQAKIAALRERIAALAPQ